MWFEIHVNPLVATDNGLLGVSVVFFDVSSTRSLLDKVVDTNRQLETAYEELQSTNDELHTTNDTLRERSSELDDARAYLDSLANSIRIGLAVVDREMRIVEWNRGCEELWGLRTDENVGELLTNLDIGLPLADIKPLIGAAFVDHDARGQVDVEAVNRRGRHTTVKVTCTAFRFSTGSINGALLLMEDMG